MNYQDQSVMRTFAIVLAGLVFLAVVFFFVARGLSKGEYAADQVSNTMGQKVVEENIKPVGTVEVAQKTAGGAQAAQSGEQVVKTTCSNCHGAGVLGAPKIGAKGDWEPRFKQAGGVDGLLKVAISGKGAMPPRGGGAYSDVELKGAIEYMLSQSGVK